MCKAIEKALADKGFGLDNGLSEIDMMVAEDDNFRNSHNERKMNRAERRRSGKSAAKKLGRQYRYGKTGWIDAYEKKEGKIVDLAELTWDELDNIDFSKVYAKGKVYNQIEEPKGKKGFSRKVRYQKIETEPDESDFEVWFRTEYIHKILSERKEWMCDQNDQEKWLYDAMFVYANDISHEDLVDETTGEVLMEYSRGFNDTIFETQCNYAEWVDVDEDGNRTVRDPEMDSFIFNDIRFDPRVREQLKNCRKSIDRWQRIVALERQRAYLMAEVHRLDREIRKVIAEF